MTNLIKEVQRKNTVRYNQSPLVSAMKRIAQSNMDDYPEIYYA